MKDLKEKILNSKSIKFKTNENVELPEDEKVIALAKLLNVDYDDIEHECDNIYNIGNREYLVVNENEREEEFIREVENYIEECILPEIPKNYHSYFDYDKFINDVRMNDGYGHVLAKYDGVEEEVIVNDTYYYIYRIN